jgi:CRISPR-associated endonuclease/helicase Cas3
VKIVYVPEDSLISSIEASSSNGGYIGIMMNTVERAQKMFSTLREKYPSDKIILLHSKFTGIDRTDIEADLMDLMSKESRKKPPFRMFVVGTQVIEQSLDLDFDLLYTEICPIDLLLQRIDACTGMTTPSKHIEDPICFVIDTEQGTLKCSEFIYGRFQLFNTVCSEGPYLDSGRHHQSDSFCVLGSKLTQFRARSKPNTVAHTIRCVKR